MYIIFQNLAGAIQGINKRGKNSIHKREMNNIVFFSFLGAKSRRPIE
jgi:hypothetical protein